MTDWLQPLSYFLTNELRLLFGLFLVAKAIPFRLERKALLFSAASGVVVTALQIASLPPVAFLAVELLVITGVAWYYDVKKIRVALFLAFFYEVGVDLREFCGKKRQF